MTAELQGAGSIYSSSVACSLCCDHGGSPFAVTVFISTVDAGNLTLLFINKCINLHWSLL